MTGIQRRNERKKEIARLEEEGGEAFRAGRHIQTVPRQYLGTMDRYHWENGWREAQRLRAQELEEGR